jgi:uncharacterized protein (DUF2267 family)
MDEETFLHEVSERLDVDKEQAEAATIAVLQVLRSRITAKEASHLDAQLPAGLKRFWQEPGVETKVSRFHKEEFFRRVGVLADIPDDEAEYATTVVFKVLQKALKSPTGREGEAGDVFSQLPMDLKKVWTAASHLPN